MMYGIDINCINVVSEYRSEMKKNVNDCLYNYTLL